MKHYTRNQIETLLRAIDAELDFPFELLIIGGTAAALGYGVSRYTKDIDTVGGIDRIRSAYEKAMDATGLDIPLGPAGVEDGPHDFQDRIKKVEISGLRCLTVKVPEKHDLALMKVIRGQQHDLDTIAEIHGNAVLSPEILIERMEREMTHVHGNKANILLGFLAMIELVFGEKEARASQRRLKGWGRL